MFPGLSTIVQSFQSRVLLPEEIVPYTDIIKQSYPLNAIQNEPFVGIKALVTDTLSFQNPVERVKYVDSMMALFKQKGCLIRETKSSIKADGYWIMTLPVPRSQVTIALNNLFDVLATLEPHGIVRDNLFEVNVSGRCAGNALLQNLSSLIIPSDYKQYLVPTGNLVCGVGTVQAINDYYSCLRTRWQFNNSSVDNTKVFEIISTLAQLIGSIYHN